MSVLSDGGRRRDGGSDEGWDERAVGDRSPEVSRKTRLAFAPKALIWAMIVPLVLNLAGLRLTPNRLLLLVMAVPCLMRLFSGRVGPLRFPEIGLILLWVWSVLALAINHGIVAHIQADGIFFLETVGAYLIGRVFVRDAESFAAVARTYFATILVLLPAAVFEAMTGHSPFLDFFNAIGHSYFQYNIEPRLGFNRVQGAFDHPILFGVYCGGAIAMAYFVLGYGRRGILKIWRSVIVLFTALACLSSGPMAAMVAQVGIIVWDMVLNRIRWRWWLLFGLAVFAWVFIDVFSTRAPPQVFISYFAMNEATAYNRINIWNFGSASVMNHPWFGVGFGEWERPSWMSASMDMYWLVVPVAYGLPAGLLNAGVFLWIFLKVALRKGLSDRQNAYRLGFLGCMLGFFLVGWTVHFWNETYVMFMFLMGSGMWFVDATPESGLRSDQRNGMPRARGPVLLRNRRGGILRTAIAAEIGYGVIGKGDMELSGCTAAIADHPRC